MENESNWTPGNHLEAYKENMRIVSRVLNVISTEDKIVMVAKILALIATGGDPSDSLDDNEIQIMLYSAMATLMTAADKEMGILK